MRRIDAQRQMEALMRQHGLWAQGWRFSWMRAKRTYGLCKYRDKVLQLSEVFVDSNDAATVGLVALHEVAHALVGPGHGHNAVWRAKCLAIGGDGKRCSSAEVEVDHAWKGTCGLCGKISKQHRAPLRVKACGTCVRVWKPEAIIVWAQHGARVPLGRMPARYVAEALRMRARYGDRMPI